MLYPNSRSSMMATTCKGIARQNRKFASGVRVLCKFLGSQITAMSKCRSASRQFEQKIESLRTYKMAHKGCWKDHRLTGIGHTEDQKNSPSIYDDKLQGHHISWKFTSASRQIADRYYDICPI